MDNFAKTLIKLRLATRKVCMCEADEKQKKNISGISHIPSSAFAVQRKRVC